MDRWGCSFSGRQSSPAFDAALRGRREEGRARDLGGGESFTRIFNSRFRYSSRPTAFLSWDVAAYTSLALPPQPRNNSLFLGAAPESGRGIFAADFGRRAFTPKTWPKTTLLNAGCQIGAGVDLKIDPASAYSPAPSSEPRLTWMSSRRSPIFEVLEGRDGTYFGVYCWEISLILSRES